MKLMLLTNGQRKVATCHYCGSKAKYLVNIHFTHLDTTSFHCVCNACAITHFDKFLDLEKVRK